ncbi:MAG: hypothetical protein CL832_10465 [Crocinitomicaceae bacterium]|mgnify:CR=1 FL=1|nr:hypothetical protein [Crocinitomicaceae bacterium]
MLNPGHQLQLKKLKQKVLEVFPGATFKLMPRQNRSWTEPSENSPGPATSENTPGTNTSENSPSENTREDSPSENSHHASIKELERKLATIKTIDELKGFANRRSIFKLNVPKWNENEKRAIQWRKMEIERGSR